MNAVPGRARARALFGAVLAILLSAASPAAANEPAGLTASHEVSQSPEEVREYWTAARMRAAVPVSTRLRGDAAPRSGRAPAGPASARSAVEDTGDPVGFPQRVHGKVFFTIRGGSSPGNFVCSATVVRSHAHTLAWTAGHCVNDAEFGGGFAARWTFVPGYRDGARPLGTWPASTLLTTENWRRFGDLRNDLGAARLARDPEGRGIQDVIGARGIAFDRSRSQQLRAFGYPAVPSLLQPQFDGGRLYTCNSPVTGSDNPPGNGPETLQIDCDMTGGASGGGWVTGDGAVNSVSSYTYVGDLLHLYGPYMGANARALYDTASGPRLLCAGRPVTNLGNAGANDFAGTSGTDSFKLAGAADRSSGRGDDDRACGGGGRDRLKGGSGADRLRGGRGRDLLIGGPGFDRCDGGPGRDRARGCERTVSVP